MATQAIDREKIMAGAVTAIKDGHRMKPFTEVSDKSYFYAKYTIRETARRLNNGERSNESD